MRLVPFIIFVLVQLYTFSTNINTIEIEYASVSIKNNSESIGKKETPNEITPPIITERTDDNKVDNKNNNIDNKSSSGVTNEVVDFISLDNSTINWWFGRNSNFQRPVGAMDIDKLKSNNSYYMGQDTKTIYLTFDEGGNNVTYVKEIVELLNKYGVKAAFFLTRNYILDNPETVKYIEESGHVIGNHSVTHPDFTTLSIDQMKAEVLGVEEAYYSVTGKEITKIFRFPKGAFSERTLGVLKALGYRCYFWSFAYADWEGDLEQSVSLSWFENYYHNGAIYLIHPKNKGNYLALETFIKDMKEKGYSFDLITSIY